MPEVSSIYDSYLVQPVAKIKENLSCWMQDTWHHYRVEFMEPLPPGPASTIDLVALSGATFLAPGTIVQQQGIPFLVLGTTELAQLRWEPLDDVDGLLWELPGQRRNMAQNLICRVNMMTRQRDLYMATSTFFLLGQSNAQVMNLEARNNSAFVVATARFIFWGHRYILKPFPTAGVSQEVIKLLNEGDRDTVRKLIGPTVWIPVSGRQA